MRRLRGMTRAELLVAAAITLLLGAVAAANLVGARIDANEASAVATLRQIYAAEVQFKAAVACDLNFNGVGEYGLIRELSGALGVRTSTDASTWNPTPITPLLPDAFRVVTRTFEVSRNGYLIHVYLPGFDGGGVGEASYGGLAATVDTYL